MADAENILDARDVSEMPKAERASMKGKGIKGGENLDWGMRTGTASFFPSIMVIFRAPQDVWRGRRRPSKTYSPMPMVFLLQEVFYDQP